MPEECSLLPVRTFGNLQKKQGIITLVLEMERSLMGIPLHNVLE